MLLYFNCCRWQIALFIARNFARMKQKKKTSTTKNVIKSIKTRFFICWLSLKNVLNLLLSRGCVVCQCSVFSFKVFISLLRLGSLRFGRQQLWTAHQQEDPRLAPSCSHSQTVCFSLSFFQSFGLTFILSFSLSSHP